MKTGAIHIEDDELELYCLGRATSSELAPIERHLLNCPVCLNRAQAALEYIDTLRAALLRLESEMGCPADHTGLRRADPEAPGWLTRFPGE